VLVTGCSTGIGLATASLLRERGFRVFASARRTRDVERLRADGFETLSLDVCNSDSIHTVLATLLSHTDGCLYGLVNNAAYGQTGAIEDLSTNLLCAQFETNFFGWHELTRRIIPVMRSAGEGRIVQISSILGVVSLPLRGAYNASKYALESYSDTLRMELAATGVAVSLVLPSPI